MVTSMYARRLISYVICKSDLYLYMFVHIHTNSVLNFKALSLILISWCLNWTMCIKLDCRLVSSGLQALPTFPPIMIVLGTTGLLGSRLILLYRLMICIQLRSCLLYSCIRFTWMSNMDAGFTSMLYSVLMYSANFILFSCNTNMQSKYNWVYKHEIKKVTNETVQDLYTTFSFKQPNSACM